MPNELDTHTNHLHSHAYTHTHVRAHTHIVFSRTVAHKNLKTLLGPTRDNDADIIQAE